MRLTDVSLNWGLASELVCAYPIPLPMVQLNVIGLAGMPARAANSKCEHPSEDTATSRVPEGKVLRESGGCSVVSTVISWSDRNREVSIPLRALGQLGQLHGPCLQPSTLPSWLPPRRLPCVER